MEKGNLILNREPYIEQKQKIDTCTLPNLLKLSLLGMFPHEKSNSFPSSFSACFPKAWSVQWQHAMTFNSEILQALEAPACLIKANHSYQHTDRLWSTARCWIQVEKARNIQEPIISEHIWACSFLNISAPAWKLSSSPGRHPDETTKRWTRAFWNLSKELTPLHSGVDWRKTQQGLLHFLWSHTGRKAAHTVARGIPGRCRLLDPIINV